MADSDAKPILLGNRSVSVLDAQGNPVEGEEAARIAIPGLQQSAQTGGSAAGPGYLRSAANWYNEHMGNLAGSLAYGADKVVNPVASALGFNPTPFESIEQAQAKAKGLTPTTPSGVATQLLGGPLVGKLGAVKGVAAGTLGGAALEGASGGDPMAGVATGFAGTAVPAAVGGAVNTVAKGVQKMTTSSGIREKVIEPWAQKVLAGLKEDVPALYNAVRGTVGSAPAKLARIHDPEVWDDAMGGLMRKAEAPIIEAVPEIPSPVQPPPAPFVYPGATAAQAAKLQALGVPAPGTSVHSVGPARPVMMKMADALEKLKQMKADARDAFDPQNPAASKPLRDAAREWENSIMAQVRQHAPDLADQWQNAMAQYSRGLRYQELGKAGHVGAEPTAQGTPFSPEGVVRQYFAQPARYAASKLPGLNRQLFPGNELGAQPSIADPNIYARAFLPAGAKFNIPTPKLVTQPGQSYGAPALADIASDLARSGVINLSETASGRR